MSSGDTGERIEALIQKYQIGTMDFLHRSLPDLSPKAVEQAVTRLLKKSRLVSYPLHNSTKYYRLSGEKHVGVLKIIKLFTFLENRIVPIEEERFREMFPQLVVKTLTCKDHYFNNSDQLVHAIIDFKKHDRRIRKSI